MIIKSIEEIYNNERFQGKDNYGKPKKAFIDALMEMKKEDFFDKCKDLIWLSAYASNNSRSDYHWQCDACWCVSDLCDNGKTYSDAYKEVVNENC